MSKVIKLIRGVTYIGLGTPKFEKGTVYSVTDELGDTLLKAEAEQGQKFFTETVEPPTVDYTSVAVVEPKEVKEQGADPYIISHAKPQAKDIGIEDLDDGEDFDTGDGFTEDHEEPDEANGTDNDEGSESKEVKTSKRTFGGRKPGVPV